MTRVIALLAFGLLIYLRRHYSFPFDVITSYKSMNTGCTNEKVSLLLLNLNNFDGEGKHLEETGMPGRYPFTKVAQECSPRGLPDSEESVVSVYTTQSNMAANVDRNVYHQIANNIAERITSPIYSFLAFYGKNKTENTTTTKKPWDKIEILDEPETVTKANQKTVDNDIALDKDVEELSSEALRKIDKKPEKITLYSSYLPSGKIEQLEGNDTMNEISDDDDTFSFDDVEEGSDEPKKRTGPFVYFLEIVGSIIQLIYGGIVALFSSSSRNNN